MKGYRFCNLLHVHDVVYGVTGLEFTTYLIALLVLCFSEYDVLFPIFLAFFFVTLFILYGNLKKQLFFYIPYFLLLLARLTLLGLLFAHFAIQNIALVERYVGTGGSFVKFYNILILIAVLFILNILFLLCLIFDVIYVWKRPKTKSKVPHLSTIEVLSDGNSIISNPGSSKKRGRNLYISAPIIIASAATDENFDDNRKEEEYHVDRDESQPAPYLHDSVPLDEITHLVDVAATRISFDDTAASSHNTSPAYEFGSSSSHEFDHNHETHNTFENTDTMSATSYYYDTQSNFDPSRYE